MCKFKAIFKIDLCFQWIGYTRLSAKKANIIAPPTTIFNVGGLAIGFAISSFNGSALKFHVSASAI